MTTRTTIAARANPARRHFERLTHNERLAAVRRLAVEHGKHTAAAASGLSVEQVQRIAGEGAR